MEKEKSLDEILFMIVKLNHLKMHKYMEEMCIYPGQPKLLQSLLKCDGISQKELAQNIFIKPATATIMLKKLEKAGLIERKVDPNDQRIIRLFLTETGRELAQRTYNIKLKLIEDNFKDFTKEEKEELKKLLLKVKKNLE